MKMNGKKSLAIIAILLMAMAAIVMVLPAEVSDAEDVENVTAISAATEVALGGKYYVTANIDLQTLPEIAYAAELPANTPVFYLKAGVSIGIQAATSISGAKVYAATAASAETGTVTVTTNGNHQATWIDNNAKVTYTNTDGEIYWSGYTDPAPNVPTICNGDVNFGNGTNFTAITQYSPSTGVTLKFNGATQDVVKGTSGAYTFKLSASEFVGSIKNVDGKITVMEWTAGDLTLVTAPNTDPLMFDDELEIPENGTLTINVGAYASITDALVNNGNIYNAGTFTLASGSTLDNSGMIYNKGTIVNNSLGEADGTTGLRNSGTITYYDNVKGTITGAGTDANHKVDIVVMIGTSTLSYQKVDNTGDFVDDAVTLLGNAGTKTVDNCDFTIGGDKDYHFGIDAHISADCFVVITNNTFTTGKTTSTYTEYMIYVWFSGESSYPAKTAIVTGNTYTSDCAVDKAGQLKVMNSNDQNAYTIGMKDTDTVFIDDKIDQLNISAIGATIDSNITLKKFFQKSSATKVTIAEGATVTVTESAIINATLVNNGTFVNYGTVENDGTITNNGTIVSSSAITGVTFRAKIDTLFYDTLPHAVAAAVSGDSILLLEASTIVSEIAVNNGVTLNLDDKKLTIDQGGKLSVLTGGIVTGDIDYINVAVIATSDVVVDVDGGIFGYAVYNSARMDQYKDGAIQIAGSADGTKGIITLQDVTGKFTVTAGDGSTLSVAGKVSPATVAAGKYSIPRMGFYGINESTPDVDKDITMSGALTVDAGVNVYAHGFVVSKSLTMNGVMATYLKAGELTLADNGSIDFTDGAFAGWITVGNDVVFKTSAFSDVNTPYAEQKAVSGFEIKINSTKTYISGELDNDLEDTTITMKGLTVYMSRALIVPYGVKAVIADVADLAIDGSVVVYGSYTIGTGNSVDKFIGPDNDCKFQLNALTKANVTITTDVSGKFDLTLDGVVAVPNGYDTTANDSKVNSITVDGMLSIPKTKVLKITETIYIAEEAGIVDGGTIDFTTADSNSIVIMAESGALLTVTLDGSTGTGADKKYSAIILDKIVAGADGLVVSKGSVIINGYYTTDADGTITIPAKDEFNNPNVAYISGNVDSGVTIKVAGEAKLEVATGSSLVFEADSALIGKITVEQGSASEVIYEEGSVVNGAVIEVTTRETEDGVQVTVTITLRTENGDKLMLYYEGEYCEVVFLEAFEGDSFVDVLANVGVEPVKSRVSFDGWYNVLNEKVTSGMVVGSVAPTLTAKFTETPREGVTPYTPSIEPTVITVDETGGYDNTTMLVAAVAMLVVAIFVLGYVVIVKKK